MVGIHQLHLVETVIGKYSWSITGHNHKILYDPAKPTNSEQGGCIWMLLVEVGNHL